MLMLIVWVFATCVLGSPFIFTWGVYVPSEIITLPTLLSETALVIDWGDNSTATQVPAGTNASSLTHNFTRGNHNISVSGRFRWVKDPQFLSGVRDIVSWGDGFLIDGNSSYLFAWTSIGAISAPPNTQPVFLPGASLAGMFAQTGFNSPLDWDLANVTELAFMFDGAKLNHSIKFRNTHKVTSMAGMFYGATDFNAPIDFDCSSVTDLSRMFRGTSLFNSRVNLTNTRNVTTMFGMFQFATEFNQPVTFQTDSVTSVAAMFSGAEKFNQPINFNTTQITDTSFMFAEAARFNQPITFSPASNLTKVNMMFRNAKNFNKPVVIDSSKITNMEYMFQNASSFASTLTLPSLDALTSIDMTQTFVNASWFQQDLSAWNVSNVRKCGEFCEWCGLPNFTQCTPCPNIYQAGNGLRICQNGTHAPSPPPTNEPTYAPTISAAPTSSAPTTPSGMSPSPAMTASSAVSFAANSLLTTLSLLLAAKVLGGW